MLRGRQTKVGGARRLKTVGVVQPEPDLHRIAMAVVKLAIQMVDDEVPAEDERLERDADPGVEPAT